MKSMLAVTQLISQQKLRKIDVLTEDTLNSKNSKFKELYLGLKSGSIRTDRDAAQKLYASDPSDVRYRQLKSRFKKRLLNTLFFVDQSKPYRSSFDQTYHNCHRDWSLVNILRVNGAHEPALQMTKSLLTVCEKYSFAELTVQTARYLANQCASKGEIKEVNQLQGIIDRAEKLYRQELEGEAILRQARLLQLESGRYSDWDALTLEVDVLQRRIDATVSASESAMLYYTHIETCCLLARILYNKERVIQLVDDVFSYSELSPRQMQESRLYKLCLWQIEIFIENRDKQKGLEALYRLESNIKIGSESWFDLQKFRIALFIRTDDLTSAFQAHAKTTKQKEFQKLPTQEIEAFSLLKMLAACFDESLFEKSNRKLLTSIEDFLNKETSFRADMQGLKAWRHLIKATLYRKLGREEELSEELAALRHLSVKQLSVKQDARMIATAQLLYRMERKHFTGDLDRVGARYYKQLRQKPYACGLNPSVFAPLDLEDMLAFFGVKTPAGLPS